MSINSATYCHAPLKCLGAEAPCLGDNDNEEAPRYTDIILETQTRTNAWSRRGHDGKIWEAQVDDDAEAIEKPGSLELQTLQAICQKALCSLLASRSIGPR